MSTTASKQAYFNPDNQVTRLSHKQRCYNALVGLQLGLTYIEIAAKAGLTYPQTWKRVSELDKEGKIIIVGTERIGKSFYSIYKINNQPPLFYTKKLGLKEWLKANYPDILAKYETLVEKKL